jgi:uncharacterized protein involved in exopolysaccharide biosynthesis
MEGNLTERKPEETDLLEKIIKSFLDKLIRYKKLIWITGIVGAILGVAFSTAVTKQYTCSVQILPEYNSGGANSGFSSLASLAGVDLSKNSKGDAFRPDLYPVILTSTTASVYLLRKPTTTVDNKNFPTLINYLDTFVEEPTPPGQLTDSVVNPTIWRLNKREKALVSSVKGRITSNFDKKSGIVVLEVKMPDPEVATNCVVLLTEYLKQFLRDYRSEKKKSHSKFLDARLKEAETSVNRAEYALQDYRDRNRNVVVNVARIHEQKLQSDFVQKQVIYNDLLKQSEKSKIEEQQEEDILITVESPTVPLSPSYPRKLFFALTGFILAIMLLTLALSKPWRLFY